MRKQTKKIVPQDFGPEIGWVIQVAGTAEKLSQDKFGTTLSNLEKSDSSDNLASIVEVVLEASLSVGPLEEFAALWEDWLQELRSGKHSLNFLEWKKRLGKRQDELGED